MSRRLQDLFWDVDLTATEQLVAQRLAWHADDVTGKCWPGIRLLCEKTGLGERAVQMAIKSLAASGHLTREERRGHGVTYAIHPEPAERKQPHYIYRVEDPATGEFYVGCRTAPGGDPLRDGYMGSGAWFDQRTSHGASLRKTVLATFDTRAAAEAEEVTLIGASRSDPLCRNQQTPASNAGRKVFAPHEVLPSETPALDALTPARRAPKQVRNPANDLEDAGASPEHKITGQRGKRIDLDWQPTKPLPDKVGKAVAGWPPGRLDDVLDEFRAFWLAEAGKIASKLDWDLTWHNRLRSQIDFDRRQEERELRRNGNRPHNDRRSGWAARPGMEGVEPASLDDDDLGRAAGHGRAGVH